MTQDEIIEMAKQVGLATWHKDLKKWQLEYGVEAFAKLVAAKEREKVARWQIGSGYTTGHGDNIEDLLVELEWQVREAEREACAKLCWSQRKYWDAEACADAIRARGEA